MAKHERSGLSAKAFAVKHGVNAGTLSWWRSKLRREEAAAEQAARFVPVVIGAPEMAHAATVERGPVEVALPNGTRLRFERQLDVTGLRDLVAAFGGPA